MSGFGRSTTRLGAGIVTHPRSEEETFFSEGLPFEGQVSPCAAFVQAAFRLYYPAGRSPSIQATVIGRLRPPYPELPITDMHDPYFHMMHTGSVGQTAFPSSQPTRALSSDAISRTTLLYMPPLSGFGGDEGYLATTVIQIEDSAHNLRQEGVSTSVPQGQAH